METQVNILHPDKEVFEVTQTYKEPMTQAQQVINAAASITYNFDRVDYPESGGIYVYYKGIMFPKKGFPFPEAIWGINLVKRTIIIILMSIGFYKIFFKKAMNKIIFSLVREADWILANYYLTELRYCECAREIKKFSEVFFEDYADGKKLAKVIATIFQYDDAYRFRVQDILTETDFNTLYSNPVSEIRRLLKILKSRGDNKDLSARFNLTVNLFCLALLVPAVRRKFRQALAEVDFSGLQYDDIDRFWILHRNDYLWQGRTFEDREAEFLKIQGNILPDTLQINKIL